jgi:hypothetical protein
MQLINVPHAIVRARDDEGFTLPTIVEEKSPKG